MEINILAIVIATVASFAVGAVWYMALFSKKWAEMHNMDKLSDAELKEMSAKMGPFYGLQLLMTALSCVILAVFIALLPELKPIYIAILAWAGFVLPVVVSSVIFGGTEAKYIGQKILIMASELLVRFIVAVLVLGVM